MLQGSSLEEPGAVCRLGFVTPTNRPSGPGTQFHLKKEKHKIFVTVTVTFDIDMVQTFVQN